MRAIPKTSFHIVIGRAGFIGQPIIECGAFDIVTLDVEVTSKQIKISDVKTVAKMIINITTWIVVMQGDKGRFKMRPDVFSAVECQS